MRVFALIMAAGSGARMGLSMNKALYPLCGRTVLERSVDAFCGLVDGAVIVTREQDIPHVQALLPRHSVVCGGETRQQSVLRGLCAIAEEDAVVLVHDAARPFVEKDVIKRCIASAKACGSGVAAIPAQDTIKQARPDGSIEKTPARETLFQAQTPQAFRLGTLKAAIERLEGQGITATDDASAMEAAGERVVLVAGDLKNIKLTTPADLAYAAFALGGGGVPVMPRVGYGYDVHRLQESRRLILCGAEIPFEKGLLGHSDADVACHALTDALLGAAALNDIGHHFPDSDPTYKGASSILLLKEAAGLVRAKGYAISNVDITITAERPKLAPYRAQMAENIARALDIAIDCVNIKAKTTEGLGFEGEGRGISAHAVALIAKDEEHT